ncbi:MAG: hypothetical protein V1792_09115 [Pseudomonadota bacterium]
MKKRILLTKDREMTNISMRMPVDLIETLRKVATLKEMPGYQSLIKYYVGQGLLNDNELVAKIQAEEEVEEQRISFADAIAAFNMVEDGDKTRDAFIKALRARTSRHSKQQVETRG